MMNLHLKQICSFRELESDLGILFMNESLSSAEGPTRMVLFSTPNAELKWIIDKKFHIVKVHQIRIQVQVW